MASLKIKVDGEWWTNGEEVAEVSVDREIAASMNLEIGDVLSFSAGGTKFSATLTSLREIEWQSFSPNFFFILSPAAGKELPNSYITSIKVEDSKMLMSNFISRFPTITSVNLEAIIDQAKSSISSASLAVQWPELIQFFR